MSPTPHLLIPLAASTAEGCRQALQDLALPQIDRLLARLTPAGLDAGSETDFSPPHERALARHLGLPAGQEGRIPWAAWHRQQMQPQAAQDAAWAFITPCQWQAGANHVLLADPALLRLTEADSRALLEILAPWFAEDGITLIYDQPTRWLARGAVFDGLATASLARVLQRDVSAWLPDKLQARALHRLHSEMQMLLYTHPFNDARAAQGLPPVNAFWAHGAGALPRLPEYMQAPEMPTTLLDAALREDWAAWVAAWKALDAGPVARLAGHVADGGSARLTLCGERSAMTWYTARRSLGQRIQGLFRPQRFASVREQL
ncbi:phosphoglycerate mutase [Alicycliphilus denitrificans]|uniref:phosphoglycerate mutase n=1 Tax=Alicycliphilus denitrificans TaxID=179636 RepID=UPI00384A7B3C